MSTASKFDQLLATAKKAVDDIVSDADIDDDSKEAILEELQDHVKECYKVFNDEDDDEDDDDEEDEDDDGDEDE